MIMISIYRSIVSGESERIVSPPLSQYSENQDEGGHIVLQNVYICV